MNLPELNYQISRVLAESATHEQADKLADLLTWIGEQTGAPDMWRVVNLLAEVLGETAAQAVDAHALTHDTLEMDSLAMAFANVDSVPWSELVDVLRCVADSSDKKLCAELRELAERVHDYANTLGSDDDEVDEPFAAIVPEPSHGLTDWCMRGWSVVSSQWQTIFVRSDQLARVVPVDDGQQLQLHTRKQPTDNWTARKKFKPATCEGARALQSEAPSRRSK